MNTTTQTSSANDTIAAFVAMLVLPFAAYLAFWVIDWTPPASPDSLLRYVLPIAFCIVIPSIIGSTIAWLVRSVRSPE